MPTPMRGRTNGALRLGLALGLILLAAAPLAEAQAPSSSDAPDATVSERSPAETGEAITGPNGSLETSTETFAAETSRSGVKVDEVDEFTIDFGSEFDWVQLSSGEWLKGSIERMRDDVLEFDSDELDMQKIDWEDVAIIRSPNVHTYVFDDRDDVSGKAVITADEVIIETQTGIEKFAREELMSIVAGKPRERNWWSSNLRFGISATAGNSEAVTYNAFLGIYREDQLTRLRLEYDGSVGKANGERNVNRHLGTAGLNVFLSPRWYITPFLAQFLSDQFQNIQFRATPAAGFGYHIIDKSDFEWDVESGVGYQYLNWRSVEAGEENPESDGFVMFRTLGSWDITGDIDWFFDWRTNLVFTNIGNTNHVGSTGMSIEVNDILDINMTFLYLRTEDPARREDGTKPEKNDYQLVFGIGLEVG